MANFDLEELSTVIQLNGFKNVALYFLEELFDVASEICVSFMEKNDGVNFKIMITCSSGVDTMQWRLNSKEDSPDCVVYFGASCLCPSRFSKHIPTYFLPISKDPETEQYILSEIQTNVESNSARKILILSDLTYSSYLSACDNLPLNNTDSHSIDICKYSDFEQQNLRFLESTKKSLTSDAVSDGFEPVYKPFLFPSKLSDYDLVFFLGQCNNLELILNSKRFIILNPLAKSSESYDGSREFRKRISLIEKFKNQSKMIGIVFVNYTNSVSTIMDSAKAFCRKLKKAPFFLTLNQNDFELRLGNFTQLDSFVLVNVCECNFDIAKQTSKYFCPVIFWREFLIVCRQQITYGGLEWNTDLEALENDEEDEEEKDESEMQMVEREIFQRPKDAWYGLIVDAGNSAVSDTIQQGLSGIPSGYKTESELF